MRFRRRIKKGQHQFEELGSQTEAGLERYVFARINKLPGVGRFVLTWVLLVGLLTGGVLAQNYRLGDYYQQLKPVPGGVYHEGMLGRFTTASPLFATSDVDTTVSKLVFAGLFRHNRQGDLVGDLAKDYQTDERGLTYTVHLKPHLSWQDGEPFTSKDVLFTYQTIQDPNTQSPLRNGWNGITITAPDKLTVVFTLPDPLAAFPQALTNGIVPEHVLHGVDPADLRTADFNTVNPIGAGPFAWKDLQVEGNDPSKLQEQISLTSFAGYNGGTPKLNGFVVRAYANQDKLVADAKVGLLQGVAGLQTVPDELKDIPQVVTRNFLFSAATMVFFKTTNGVLSDQKVRSALVQSVDVPSLLKQLGYPTHRVREPLLTGRLAYDPKLAQPDFNLAAAKQLLDQDGWVMGKDGVRHKEGQKLTFALTVNDSAEYKHVASYLRRAWFQAGVDADVKVQTASDFQNSLAYHDYDAILYGIAIGDDPDVFAYWDSSQADVRSPNRLNLSEYKNPKADSALEAGRTRLDPTLRTVKYRPFLQAWQQDLPALALYQPRYLYLTYGPVDGMTDHSLTTPVDRFANVHNWEIRQAKVSE